MKRIVYDVVSGNPRPGVVWEVDSLPFSDFLDRDFVYAECVKATGIEEVRCPVNPDHCINLRFRHVTIDFFGGGNRHLGAVIPLTNHGMVIVSEDFAEKFWEQEFTGAEITPVKDNKNQFSFGVKHIYQLDVTAFGVSRRCRITGGSNLCPHCHQVPVICTGCGAINNPCPECGLRIKMSLDDPAADFLVGPAPTIKVVDQLPPHGEDWFGTTGCHGSWFISNRVKQWFDREGFFGFEISPALIARGQ